MFCPYAVTRIIKTTSYFEYDEDGRNTKAETTEYNNAVFVDCQKENCGAYKNKRCCYNGSKT